MVYNNSTYYYRFFDEIEDRLDFAYNNPIFDVITNLSSIAKYKVLKIYEIIEKEENFSSGKTPRKIKYIEKGVPFLGAGNIQDDEIDFSNVTFIDNSYHTGELSSSTIIKGDILISMAGTIGRVAVYNEDYEANCNQAVARLRISETKYFPKFISKYLMSKYGQLAFGKYRHDVSQPNINLDEIKLIPLVLPDYETQKKIFKKIEPLEKEVSKLKRELKKKKEEADNLIYQFLGFENYIPQKYFFKEGKDDTISFWLNFDELNDRIDFLHYHPKHKLINELSKKVKLIELKEILSAPINRGVSPEFSDTGIVPCLKTVDLKNRIIDFENSLKVDTDFYEQNTKFKVKKGDVILASTGFVSMGKVDVVPDEIDCLITGELLGFSIDLIKYDPYFIAFFLRSDFGQSQIEKYWTGSSGQIHLNPNEVEKILIPNVSGISKNKQEEISEEIQKAIDRSIEIEDKIKELKIEIKNKFEKELLNE